MLVFNINHDFTVYHSVKWTNNVIYVKELPLLKYTSSCQKTPPGNFHLHIFYLSEKVFKKTCHLCWGSVLLLTKSMLAVFFHIGHIGHVSGDFSRVLFFTRKFTNAEFFIKDIFLVIVKEDFVFFLF